MPLEDNYSGLDYINGTILIVTDDIDMNIVLSGTFALNGFKCFKCSSAEEALKTLDEHINTVDSMLIDGKIAADRGALIIVKSKTKKPEIKIVVVEVVLLKIILVNYFWTEVSTNSDRGLYV